MNLRLLGRYVKRIYKFVTRLVGDGDPAPKPPVASREADEDEAGISANGIFTQEITAMEKRNWIYNSGFLHCNCAK